MEKAGVITVTKIRRQLPETQRPRHLRRGLFIPPMHRPGMKGLEIYRSASVKFASFSNSSMSESGLPFVVDG